MYSGSHISRLSVRGVINGYQYYKTGRHDRMLNSDNFLIINEGQQWYSEIEAEHAVEAIVVAFHPAIVKEFIYSLSTTSQDLLDNPFYPKSKALVFFENTNLATPELRALFLRLSKIINADVVDQLLFEELQFNLLQILFNNYQDLLTQAELIPAKKKSVQIELLQRLGLARDYILANLDQKIVLSDIAQVATLSPFHFLRLFKAVYQITPHQFIRQERINLAQYLLSNSSKSIQEICFDTGFENPSAFGRVFKSFHGKTPSQVRLQHQFKA